MSYQLKYLQQLFPTSVIKNLKIIRSNGCDKTNFYLDRRASSTYIDYVPT